MSKTHETFATLDELINSHLSKLSDSGHSQGSDESIHTETSMKTGTMSDFLLINSPNKIIPTVIPEQVNNEITNILAMQLANALKVRTGKIQQEKLIVKNESEESFNIDFTDAIIEPQQDEVEICKDYKPKGDGCCDLENNAGNVENPVSKANNVTNTPEESLPCLEDLSHLLNAKIKKMRCSTFGRVLCATYRNTYLPDHVGVHEKGIEFDFSTPSADKRAGKAQNDL
ncbi:hypothetical protein EVAR_50991_1 [Eumeta japonica]|uniref:Uncharacterized protein n=1 Tax=Eumeta variegata TaxID=151549 RepID=A0A4C1ZTJ6_EUMVA|nr:hypothetical protein EVAR_50991_1 [Eumeta japonica]